MLNIKASEFRNNFKKYLDKAVNGETIYIERGAVIFQLTATNAVGTPPNKTTKANDE